MNIAILCVFYNCHEELKRLLSSIPENCIEYLIAIDGVYRYPKEQNPDLSELSDDGSRQVIMTATEADHIPNKIIVDFPNKLEFEKRNKYLEICETMKDKIDVGIIIDSDEFILYPEGTRPADAFFRFKQNLEKAIKDTQGNHNVFAIRSLNLNENPPYEGYYPRIFYKPGEMRYLNGSHYYYGNIYREKKDIELFNSHRHNYVQYSHSITKGVILGHHHNLRSKEHMKMRAEYIPYLVRFEGLTQSHKYSLEESHKLASIGVEYNKICSIPKDEVLESIKKYIS